MVNFYKPRFNFSIKHDVEAKDLEGHAVFQVFGLAALVGMSQARLN